MRTQASSLVLAVVLVAGSVGTAVAQGIGGGETTTPNSNVTNPKNPAINDPNSPAASNRGDPGSEPINPNTGGPTMGQGTTSPPTPSIPQGTFGQGRRDPNAQSTPVEPRQLPDSANPNGR